MPKDLLPPIEATISAEALQPQFAGSKGQPDDTPTSVPVKMTWGTRRTLRDQAIALGISTTQHTTNIVLKALEE